VLGQEKNNASSNDSKPESSLPKVTNVSETIKSPPKKVVRSKYFPPTATEKILPDFKAMVEEEKVQC
jgi:hypothetical protein